MARRNLKNVGLIGLGIIGRRVGDSLRKKGFQVYVWNRTPRPVQNFLGSPAEVAQLCEVVQIFVADGEALLEMVRQLSPALGAQHIILAHCTIAPETMREAAAIVQRRGARFLDAPFTGSKLAAEKGELNYYIGGDEVALREVRPILEASSKTIVEIGEIGQASLIKLATNMVTAATVQVAAEALALVRKSGLAAEKLIAAMPANASNSATLAFKLPKMTEGDFEPHFSVKHMLKDVHIVAALAAELGLELPATEAARNALLAQLTAGRGDDDFCSVVRKYFPEAGAERRTAEPAPAPVPATNGNGAGAPADPEMNAEPETALVASEARGPFGWFRRSRDS
jgi:3-hydroxyisobutyrate dehydrogenase-like beta-hydroxyacid dehydrogenase